MLRILSQVIAIVAFTGALIGAVPTGLVSPAQAQGVCSPRATVVDQLSENFKEAPVAAGITNNGGVVEVLTSDYGLTWTIIVSTPDGKSCLIASGEGWRAREAVAAVVPEVGA